MKLLICLTLLGFTACGVKGPPVPYVEVVAKEKAQEEAKLKKETPPTPTPAPEPVKTKKKANTKKK